MAVAYLGIGSNLGDRQANIDKALGLLKENPEIEVLAVSQFIETKPVGGPPQGDFLNGALKVETELRPLELLSKLKIIERRLGRASQGELNSPRPIDLDILFYDDIVIVDGKTLTVPHPRAHERGFVLRPMAEIAPEFVHPRLQKSMKALADESLSKLPSA